MPIPANPALDPNNTAAAAYLTANKYSINANMYEFGVPIHDTTTTDPRYQVTCTMNWGPCPFANRTTPIPTWASANTGSDGVLVTIDPTTHTSHEFWQLRRSGTNWTTSWGAVMSTDGDGRANSTTGAAVGAGVSRLAGVVRVNEIRQGRIDHALTFSTTNACNAGRYRYPAAQTDGASSRSDCIPEGTRIQLDPTINVDTLPGITPAERAIAKALQTYGAYCVDNGGSNMAFAFELPTQEDGTDPYPTAGLGWDYYHMPNIPWARIRVLRTWDGT